MSVSVLGAGAFGTALAIALSAQGPVRLWTRSATQAADMAANRVNAGRLPDVRLPDAVQVVDDLAEACGADVILLAVPTQQLRGFLSAHRGMLGNRPLVACCKGAEIGSGLGPVGVIAEEVPDVIAALLTGPSFANDIASGLPTALTLACADENATQQLQSRLTTGTLRLYRTNDVAGAEMGGALKNVVAIGCGTVIGAGLGESARAALMTRGYAEMLRLAVARGARAETLAGLSGLGDLALTCMSEQSRNFRRGLALGRGEEFDNAITVEGAATAQAVLETAQKTGLDVPITAMVTALLAGQVTVKQAMGDLLARPLKEE